MESWLRGSKEGSYCKPKYKYKVVDVQSMVVTGTDGTKINWTEGQVRGEEEEKKKERRKRDECQCPNWLLRAAHDCAHARALRPVS